MEPSRQTYKMLGRGGQISGGSRWTAGRRPLWENTVQVNLQYSIHKEWRALLQSCLRIPILWHPV